ncbi:hypothetical protein CHUAL_001252 [Chamberlinius hualienensis]
MAFSTNHDKLSVSCTVIFNSLGYFGLEINTSNTNRRKCMSIQRLILFIFVLHSLAVVIYRLFWMISQHQSIQLSFILSLFNTQWFISLPVLLTFHFKRRLINDTLNQISKILEKTPIDGRSIRNFSIFWLIFGLSLLSAEISSFYVQFYDDPKMWKEYHNAFLFGWKILPERDNDFPWFTILSTAISFKELLVTLVYEFCFVFIITIIYVVYLCLKSLNVTVKSGLSENQTRGADIFEWQRKHQKIARATQSFDESLSPVILITVFSQIFYVLHGILLLTVISRATEQKDLPHNIGFCFFYTRITLYLLCIMITAGNLYNEIQITECTNIVSEF